MYNLIFARQSDSDLIQSIVYSHQQLRYCTHEIVSPPPPPPIPQYKMAITYFCWAGAWE